MKKYMSLTAMVFFGLTTSVLAQTSTFTSNLSLGSSGTSVTNLQTWLIDNGFDISTIRTGQANKGYFGLQTQKAVQLFQSQNAIPSTGYVGQLTRARLNELTLKPVTKKMCQAVFSSCSCSTKCIEIDPSEPRADCARYCGGQSGDDFNQTNPYQPTCGYVKGICQDTAKK